MALNKTHLLSLALKGEKQAAQIYIKRDFFQLQYFEGPLKEQQELGLINNEIQNEERRKMCLPPKSTCL